MNRSEGNRSALFLAFVLREPRLHEFFDQWSRQWLVRREVDGPFGCGEPLQFVLERLDHRRSREQTAMVRKRSDPHQRPSFVFECRYPVADGLGGFRRHSGPNRSANFVQCAVGRFRYGGKVFVNAFRSVAAFRGRSALAGFCFLYAGHAARILEITRSKNPRPGRSRPRIFRRKCSHSCTYVVRWTRQHGPPRLPPGAGSRRGCKHLRQTAAFFADHPE
jgi:hypothetical protein